MIRNPLRSGLTALLLVVSSLSVAAAPDRFGESIERARLVDTLSLRGELFHVQGLEMDDRRIWVTSVDRLRRRGFLHEFDRANGTLLRRVELTEGARYHPGGISLSGASIWVPLSELRPNGSATLVEIARDTLETRRKIPVDDHVGCVAATDTTLVAGNWNSELLYVFDLADPARRRVIRNPSGTQYQDMKFRDGALVASGTRGWLNGAIDWIDWPSGTVSRTRRAGAIGPVRPLGRGGPFTGEGMAIDGSDLYLLPEDGPSRLFHFRLDDD